MFSNRYVPIAIILALFTLLLGSSVMADDGRINRAPYHFGGDTLYCTQEEGCTLLNDTGLSLANWPQDDIATAFAATDQSGQNILVAVYEGTYGPMQLWSVSPDATTGNHTLCLIGFDEWGKKNDMCFYVTPDYKFEQAALPVATKPIDCSMWNTTFYVRLIANPGIWGKITSINAAGGTVIFGASNTVAACNTIELGPA